MASILKNAAPDSSCAQWALRFAASLDGVFMVLSGMSSVEQMRDNLAFMTDFQPLSDREMRLVAQVREALGKLPVIPCTACSYCTKVCPANIGIPGTFEALNLLNLYHNFKLASGKEWWNTEGHHKEHANRCLHCGKCESACSQHIPIRKHLAEAAEEFKLNG